MVIGSLRFRRLENVVLLLNRERRHDVTGAVRRAAQRNGDRTMPDMKQRGSVCAEVTDVGARRGTYEGVLEPKLQVSCSRIFS
jgi:hypothetical protein